MIIEMTPGGMMNTKEDKMYIPKPGGPEPLPDRKDHEKC
jgi:hypothetical protein